MKRLAKIKSQCSWTHLCPPPWIVSTGSRRRWKWPLWWTLCRTASPRSPSASSAGSSGPSSCSCICRRRSPRPRPESTATASFTWGRAEPSRVEVHLGSETGVSSPVHFFLVVVVCPSVGARSCQRCFLCVGLVLQRLGFPLFVPCMKPRHWFTSQPVHSTLSPLPLYPLPPSPYLPLPRPPSHARHLDWWQWRTCSYFFIVILPLFQCWFEDKRYEGMCDVLHTSPVTSCTRHWGEKSTPGFNAISLSKK